MNLDEQIAAMNAEDKKAFAIAKAELDITEAICEAMERDNVTKKDLAKRAGLTEKEVTRALRDGPTFKEAITLALALGYLWSFRLEK